MNKRLILIILLVAVAALAWLLISGKRVSIEGSRSRAEGISNQRYYDSVKDKCVGQYKIRNVQGTLRCVDSVGNWVVFPALE